MISGSLAALKPYLSFFHPIAMWILLGIALYVMYLGVQVGISLPDELIAFIFN